MGQTPGKPVTTLKVLLSDEAIPFFAQRMDNGGVLARCQSGIPHEEKSNLVSAFYDEQNKVKKKYKREIKKGRWEKIALEDSFMMLEILRNQIGDDPCKEKNHAPNIID